MKAKILSIIFLLVGILSMMSTTSNAATAYSSGRVRITDISVGDIISKNCTIYKNNGIALEIYDTDGTTLLESYGTNGFIANVQPGYPTIVIQSGSTVKIKKLASEPQVTSVSLDESTLSLIAGGEAATLTPTVTANYDVLKGIKWTSSETSVATISNGVVTPVAEGSTTITVTSTWDGTKTATCIVTVTAPATKSLQDEWIQTIEDQTYTGSAIEPEITVTDGEKTLTLGTDYEVSYTDNTNVGTATATITGINNYSGTITKEFGITPKVTTLGALTLTEDQNGVAATIDGNYDQADALTITEDIAVKSVTYNRSFAHDGGAYTIMLPFSFTVTNAVKGTFHTLSTLEPTETETVWKATMSEAITTIEANKPYIFVPSEDFSEMTFSNVTLKKTTSAPLINVCANTNWKLHGVYSQKVWTDEDVNNYGFAAAGKGEIAAGEFVHFVTGATLKPTRCYLEYSKDGFSKSAVVLPEKIIVVFPETSSVIEPNDPENNNGNVITPVSEIAPNSGVKVWSYDGTIFIEAQPNTDYSVIDITGRTLKTGVTSSTRETVTLSRRAAGIVIVKINGKTFKINY